MDYESQHLLRHISERDRTLANYLKVMNKRIDLLGQVMVQSLLKEIGEPRKVSLSEGGVSFHHDRALPVGQLLVLRMVLLPQGFGLELRARVIHAQPHDDEFEIGTEFEALSDAQRQLLARHILQKQAQQRRLARLDKARSASRANLLRPEMYRCSVRYCCAPSSSPRRCSPTP